MEIIKVENLNFTYPERKNKALSSINLSVKEGEFITLMGRSGSGKTTLLRMLKNSIAPFGETSGKIYFNGKELNALDLREEAGKIGFVMQDADNQIVTDKVWHEMAFGLESLGEDNAKIRAKVAEMASFFGIEKWFYKNTDELSGGQKQLLNLASIMVMQPSVLLLDEPTSQLDPISASEFLKAIEKINKELSVTVILSEHRLSEAFSLADRILVMDEGEIIIDEKPVKVGELLRAKNHPMSLALPTPVKIHQAVENPLECPLTVKEGREWLLKYSEDKNINREITYEPYKNENKSENIIETKEVYYRYDKEAPDAVKGLELKIMKGEIFAILGGNGTGKTTALSLISGLLKPYRGEVLVKGKKVSDTSLLNDGIIGMLPQNPKSVFTKKALYLDFWDILSKTSLTEEEKEERIKNISSLCKIEGLLNHHPYDLSGGEVQRAALAMMLLRDSEILLLDEPTKGMDAHFKEIFGNILKLLKEKGKSIVLVSHDVEFCAAFAQRCGLFFNGNIVSLEKRREFFKCKSFYTTEANRMARSILPEAVLPEDVILALGGKIPEKEEIKYPEDKEKKEDRSIEENDIPKGRKKEKRKISKRTVLAGVLILFIMPLTIFLGTQLFHDRKYYFISLLIMLETFIPFMLVFEGRKPRARELVIISVLCALAVVGREAFFMLPQFKPVLAIVIIAGVSFGGETGFLVGAVTGFVSNFFFGQGPWTVWQMFALGVTGFLSGVIFDLGILKKTKISLGIFGFTVAILVYGGIMNPASVIMWQDKITVNMLLASYAAGISFDLVHGISTGFFLWFISGSMIEKIDRVKMKYGLLD